MDENQVKRKKITFKPLFVGIIGIICLCLGMGGGYFLFYTPTENTTSNEGVLYEVIDVLNQNWVDSTESEIDVNTRMITGLVNGLGDIHSSYMSKDEITAFNDSINGDFEGIGVTYTPVDEGALITKVFEDSPAQKAGLKIGDIITACDGVSLSGKTSDEVKNIVRGASGSEAVLSIISNGSTANKKVTRAAVSTDVFFSIRTTNNKKFGFLQITTFGDNTATQVEMALESFKDAGIDSIIIDLRDNGGGYLTAAQGVLELFNKKDTVIYQMQDKEGNKTEYKTKTDEYYSFDQGYILINGSTASASELISGALSELQNYQLVGEQSYGKGTAQTQKTLSDLSVLKYTYAKWLTPKGVCVHGKGLTPDIKVSNTDLSDLSLSSFKTVYKYDSVSTPVKSMQIMLKHLGYKVDREDGYFSKNTETALKAFEKASSLTVDGQYSDNDYKHLLGAFSVYLSKIENDQQYKEILKLIK